MTAAMNAVRATIAEALDTSGLAYDQHGANLFEVSLPGERKLQTACRLDIGAHALGVHAFVCRNPDENFEGVYRWMLERNLKMFGVAFAVDHNGDIYLEGRIALHAVTVEGE